VFAAVFSLFGFQLMKMQIVDGESYARRLTKGYESRYSIEAARGEILDRNLTPLVKNDTGFNIMCYYAYMDADKKNAIILYLTKVLAENGEMWIDSLPISTTEPFVFKEGEEAAIARLKKDLGIQNFGTVKNAMSNLCLAYDIPDSYTAEEIRTVVGVRREMDLRDFSEKIPFTFAENVSNNTVAKISENKLNLPGVKINESTIRKYVSGSLAPHLIGQVGPLYREDMELIESGEYAFNDTIGRGGIESAMEQYLRGKKGEALTQFDYKYEVINEDPEITKEPVPGNTVVLTLDSKLQALSSQAMEKTITYLQENQKPGQGMEANAGAVAVIEVKTGAIRALSTYPSYNVDDYRKDYETLLRQEGNPLFNRALQGLYAPGSCYKPMIATAGLNEGIITPESAVLCQRYYTFYHNPSGNYPSCMGYHGNINAVNALRVSCNIFFYDTGRLLGIEKINQYSSLFGFGQPTGIEVAERIGQQASPEFAASIGYDWFAGDVLQASIGQSYNQFSPLQIANYTATIARRGVLLETHLVDSIISYNGDKVIKKIEPVVISKIDAQEGVLDTVIEGMRSASTAAGTAGGTFGNYPVPVASKTGTPQTSGTLLNSVFICFAPIDDPEIAIAVVIENGGSGLNNAPVARDILNAWFFNDYDVNN
jgi:penicillin-binding protein 2